MTKRRVGVSIRYWFEGSQVSKARPGAPFDFPFDIAEGTSFVISLPTRLSESAARDDKKERVVVGRGRLLDESVFVKGEGVCERRGRLSKERAFVKGEGVCERRGRLSEET
jgi:hypothetical protein